MRSGRSPTSWPATSTARGGGTISADGQDGPRGERRVGDDRSGDAAAIREVTRKFAGGKLVRVEVELRGDGRIASAVLSGDFFLHPEEAVSQFEGWLTGADGSGVEAAVARAEGSGWTLVGADWPGIGAMLVEAMGEKP